MIVHPKVWNRSYENYMPSLHCIEMALIQVLKRFNVINLSYSGGIDSTILLCLMTRIFGRINTFTISSREDNPDVLFAREGSRYYKSNHTEIISDKFFGEDVYEEFYRNIKGKVKAIICGDGVDEFMCGYYKHLDESEETYKYFLSRLSPDHLVPLDKLSGNVQVYLPYLDTDILNLVTGIPLKAKVDSVKRKKEICSLAFILGVPKSIIDRNKYGFIDAFRLENK